MGKSDYTFRYKVRNWPEYNRALVKRGQLTLWFDTEAVAAWRHPGGTVKLSRIRPFCGRILLDQRLRINDLAVAAGGENAAKLLNLTVPSWQQLPWADALYEARVRRRLLFPLKGLYPCLEPDFTAPGCDVMSLTPTGTKNRLGQELAPSAGRSGFATIWQRI